MVWNTSVITPDFSGGPYIIQKEKALDGMQIK